MNQVVILSIKPKFVEMIFSGEKTYEYRKFRFGDNINKILFYASSPVKRVVGEAMIEGVVEGSPMSVWNQTYNSSGIDKDFFDKYYMSKDIAFAYKLNNVKRYELEKTLEDFGISNAPQSYCYIRVE